MESNRIKKDEDVIKEHNIEFIYKKTTNLLAVFYVIINLWVCDYEKQFIYIYINFLFRIYYDSLLTQENTFTEYLLENGFECESGICTEIILDEGESNEEDWSIWESNTTSTYYELQNKFVIDDIYITEWYDGATHNMTTNISIYLSSGNVEVTSSSIYLSGDNLYQNETGATATTTLYDGGWECTVSSDDISYCNRLKTSVDEWIEYFVMFYNLYKNGE